MIGLMATPPPRQPSTDRNEASLVDARGRVTSADVARSAGVSRATVSYVLNNTPHQVIPDATRQRVLDAAAELGYMPSAAARALSRGRSEVVLLLLPDWPIGPSLGSLLESLSAALADLGYAFVVHPRSAHRPVAEVWKAITPAAVVTLEELDESESSRLTAAGIELEVALYGGHRGGRALDIPEERVGRMQAEFLASAGHRKLAYALPDDPRVEVFVRPRLEGVRQSCVDLGLPAPRTWTVPLDEEAAARAVAQMRSSDAEITGVCAYNDDVALAVLSGLQQLGLRAPRDLAVIGVDNTPVSAVSVPSLTSVRTDQSAVARFISESIVGRLEGRPTVPQLSTEITTVVVRDSV